MYVKLTLAEHLNFCTLDTHQGTQLIALHLEVNTCEAVIRCASVRAWSPLVALQSCKPAATLRFSHRVMPSQFAGGKWTTYRLMAQDAIDHALKTGKLGVQARPCATTHLKLVCS